MTLDEYKKIVKDIGLKKERLYKMQDILRTKLNEAKEEYIKDNAEFNYGDKVSYYIKEAGGILNYQKDLYIGEAMVSDWNKFRYEISYQYYKIKKDGSMSKMYGSVGRPDIAFFKLIQPTIL